MILISLLPINNFVLVMNMKQLTMIISSLFALTNSYFNLPQHFFWRINPSTPELWRSDNNQNPLLASPTLQCKKSCNLHLQVSNQSNLLYMKHVLPRAWSYRSRVNNEIRFAFKFTLNIPLFYLCLYRFTLPLFLVIFWKIYIIKILISVKPLCFPHKLNVFFQFFSL